MIFKSLIKKFNLPTLLLALSMFFTGASGIITQNLLSVTASNILGNTFVQFGITIALMLGSMGIGGTAQKYINGNLLRRFITIEMLLVLLTAFAPITLYSVYAVMPEHFKIIQYFWIILTGFLIGFEIPLISRINEQYQPDLKDNLASIVTMDYIGSMIGGIIWVFLFLGQVDLATAAFITAALNFLVAISAWLFFKKSPQVESVESIMICSVALLCLVGFYNRTGIFIDMQQKLYDERIVFSTNTKYQNIVVTHDKKINDYRLFINGNLQFSSLDEHIYHEHLVHPAMEMSTSKSNVLVLGGGDGLAVREILKYDDVKSITLVDLDQEMINLFKDDPILASLNDKSFQDARVTTQSPNIGIGLEKTVWVETGKWINDTLPKLDSVASVEVYALDAFSFVRNTRNKLFDIVIIDFPDPSNIEIAKLYSKEFYIHLQGLLSPEGLIAIQSTSPYHASKAFTCIGKTLNSAGYSTLRYHQNVPSFGDWGWHIATLSDMDLKNKFLGINSFKVKTKFLTPEVNKSSLAFGKILDENVKESTLMQPRILSYYVKDGWMVE